MLGYDMGWAAFHVVEVMSSPRYHLKTVGYLGASQSFNEDTDVLMLTTNLLKKVPLRSLDVNTSLNFLAGFELESCRCINYPEWDCQFRHSRTRTRPLFRANSHAQPLSGPCSQEGHLGALQDSPEVAGDHAKCKVKVGRKVRRSGPRYVDLTVCSRCNKANSVFQA